MVSFFIGFLLLVASSVNPVEHEVISAKRNVYGFESTLKLGGAVTDNRDLLFEIMHPDSSISFMVPIWPTDQEFTKGKEFSNFFFVADDTLSVNDRVATLGTYAPFYPDSGICLGKASIAFYTQLPSLNREGFLLPDVKLEYGVLIQGDTVHMSDGLGQSSVCKIESIEMLDRNQARIPLPFLMPNFCTQHSQVSVFYSMISGSPMSENIRVSKK